MRQALLSALILFLIGSAQAELFDSSAFKEKSSPEKQKPQTPGGEINKEKMIETRVGEEFKELSDKDIDVRIDSLTTLIDQEADPQAKGGFLLNRANLYLQKAKRSRVRSEDKTSKVGEAEKKHLSRARKDIESVVAIPSMGAKERAYSQYLLGLIAVDLGQAKNARQHFNNSLKLAPKEPYATGIAFFMAEYHYENDRFKSALKLYEKFEPQMDKDERAMADYKKAWCQVGLRHYEEAEKLFTSIITTSAGSPFVQDAIRDLAYVVSHTRNEIEVVKLADRLFPKENVQRLEFLSGAYASFQRKNPNKKWPRLFKAMIELAASSTQRLQVWLGEVRARRKEFASLRHYSAFESMMHEVKRLSEEDRKAALDALGSEIRWEADHLIRSLVDTYAGRKKNKEKISQTDIGQYLREIFQFYDDYIPLKEKRDALYRLWFEVCGDLRQYQCLYDVSQRALANPELKSFHDRARMEQIMALDGLVKVNPKKYKAELVRQIEDYLKDEERPRWSDFADLLASLYIEDGREDVGIGLLEKVVKKEPSEKSYYRWQAALFKAGAFEEILSGTVPKAVKVSRRIIEIQRESALQLAMGAKSRQDSSQYFDMIQKYLSFEPPLEKRAIVLRDYVEFLMSQRSLKRAYQVMVREAVKVRSHPEMVAVARLLFYELLKSGVFDEAGSLLRTKKGLVSEKLRYERALVQVAGHGNIAAKDLQGLASDQREYLFGVLTLTQPQNAIEVLQQRKPKQKALRQLGFLAVQIISGKENLQLNKKMTQLLGDAVPQEMRYVPPLPAELWAQKVKIPKKVGHSKTAAQKLNRAMDAVRKIRLQVAKDLKGQPAHVKLRVLRQVVQLEKEMAKVIASSSVPKGLSRKQVREYRKGLQEVAMEFHEQAKEFSMAGNKLLNEVRNESPSVAERLPAARPTSWVWPQSEVRRIIFSLIKRKQHAGALIMLDLRRGDGTMPVDDYYRFRAGVLLARAGSNPVLRTYVRDELIAAGQRDLMKAWMKM